MKHIISIAFIAFIINARAQITLEYSYDSSSNYISGSKLMLIKFEVSGERYIRVNKEGKSIDVYDINHSHIKTISYSDFPQSSNGISTILYFSEQLFNTDSKAEFIYIYSQGNPSTVYTQIYNEDGQLIFSVDSMAPLVNGTVPQEQRPIYNTSQGTKLLLCHQTNGQAKVFALPGTLSTAIAEANGQLMQAQSGQGQFSGLYPNPSNGAVTLQYELPKGETQGEIIL
mgnify:CR=1 FL=1